MSEEEARAEIISILSERGLYAVIWLGHFGDSIALVKPKEGRTIKSDIYGALYEQYYDVVRDDGVICNLNLPEGKDGFVGILKMVKEALTE